MPLQFTTRKVLIAFALAVFASLLNLAAPAYTGTARWQAPLNREASSLTRNESSSHPARRSTLAEVNGTGIYFLLTIPVVLAGLPLLFRFRAVRILSAVLIAGWVVVGAASIGLFYIPSAVMMVWSAFGKSA
jgi:hypothetical protein